MLDLNFVRDNLPRVEEMLRQRGADPAAVLKDFREVDTQRRQAITEAETMKARRNQGFGRHFQAEEERAGRDSGDRRDKRVARADPGAGENCR